jgi:hypothetical protein
MTRNSATFAASCVLSLWTIGCDAEQATPWDGGDADSSDVSDASADGDTSPDDTSTTDADIRSEDGDSSDVADPDDTADTGVDGEAGVDADTSDDADTEVDAATDATTDADTDADTTDDGEADATTDTDTDSEVDADVEVDAEVDSHTTGDADADTDPDTSDDEPPTPTLTITPATPDTNAALAATLLSPEDPDALDLTTTWAWTVDGIDADIGDTAVEPALTTQGERWTARVTLTNSRGRSATASATVLIAGTAPTLASTELVPTMPFRSTIAECTPSGAFDADGDDVEPDVRWLRWRAGSETAQVVAGDALTRSLADLVPGDEIACEVTPIDPYLVGTAVLSPRRTIANAVPTVEASDISPRPASADDVLTCEASGINDADGDALTIAYRWFVNDELLPSARAAILRSGFGAGDDVFCEVTASDAWDQSAPATSTTLRIGAAPVAVHAPIVRAGSYCEVPLCELPADLDAMAGSATFGWRVNDVAVSGTALALDDVALNEGDRVACSYTLDGEFSEWSADVVIRDESPTLSGASLQRSARVGDTLVCSPLGYADDCSEPAEYTFGWLVDGRLAPGENSDAFSTAGLDAGTEVLCVTTASDGLNESPAVFSAPLPLDSLGYTIAGAQTGERFGWDVALVGDLNGDELGELLVGAPSHDYVIHENAGAAYLINGRVDVDALNATDAIDDGMARVWYGESGSYDVETMACGTYIFPGGCPTLTEPGEGDAWVEGPNGPALGFRVASGGDIDGDGVVDLLMAAPYYQGSGLWAGRAYAVSGAYALEANITNIANARDGVGFRLDGECGRRRNLDRVLGAAAALRGANGDTFAYNLIGAGDTNGDGLADLAAQAPNHGGNDLGAVYLVYGRDTFSAFALDAIAYGGCTNSETPREGQLGAQAGARFRGTGNDIFPSKIGFRMSRIGDVNGDGLDDTLLMPRLFGGSLYIALGGYSAADTALADVNAAAELAPDAPAAGIVRINPGSFGFDLSGITSGRIVAGFAAGGGGDVNGDGFDDIVFTMLSADYDAAILVWFGRAELAAYSNLDADMSGDGILVTGDFGFASDTGEAAIVGDLNGDGFDDVAVGAPNEDGGGRVYVIWGRATPATVTRTQLLAGEGGFVVNAGWAASQLGESVAGGDIDGDGLDDLLFGAPLGGDDGEGVVGVEYGRDYTSAIDEVGGSGADNLVGTDAAESFVAGRGDDEVVGGGGQDVFYLGAGDDVVTINDASFQRVRGGSGEDTLVLAPGCGDVDLVASRGRIEDIERIELNGQSLSIGRLDVLRLSDTSNRLIIAGDAGTLATVSGEPWQYDGQLTFEGREYTTLSAGRAELWIDTRLTTQIPPSMPDQTFLINENSVAGTNVGTINAADPDGPTLDFALVSAVPEDVFLLDENSGRINVLDSAPLDFEGADWPFVLEVRATDNAGLTTVSTITVELRDVPEAPTFLGSTTVFAAEENGLESDIVASVAARDPDAGDVVTFSVDDVSSALFEINALGQISTVAGRSLDFELAAQHTVVVAATDTSGLRSQRTITINVLDRDVLERESVIQLSARERGIWQPGPATAFPGFEASLVDATINEVDFCVVFNEGDYTQVGSSSWIVPFRFFFDITGSICTRADVEWNAGTWNSDINHELRLVYPDSIVSGVPFAVESSAELLGAPTFWGTSMTWDLKYELEYVDVTYLAEFCYDDTCELAIGAVVSALVKDKFSLDAKSWSGTSVQLSDTSFMLESGVVASEPFQATIDWEDYWIQAFDLLGLPSNRGTVELDWSSGAIDGPYQSIDYLLVSTDLGYLGEYEVELTQQVDDIALLYVFESGSSALGPLDGTINLQLSHSDDVDGDGDVDVSVTPVVTSDFLNQFRHTDTLGTVHTILQAQSTITLSNGVTLAPENYGPVYYGGCSPAMSILAGPGEVTGREECLVMIGTENYAFDTSDDWEGTTIYGSFQLEP